MLQAHRTPMRMARCLVGYIPCDERVRREVLTEFSSAPSTRRIAEIRAELNRPPAEEEYPTAGWDWRGDKLRERMSMASQSFVMALQRERGGWL